MKTLRIFFVLALLFSMLDFFDFVLIKGVFLKKIIYWGAIIFPMLIVIGNFRKEKPQLIVEIIALIFIPVVLLFSFSGPWQTQAVIFENKSFSNYKIEEQWKNPGAVGRYKIRKSKVFYVSPFFGIIISKKVNLKIIPESNWKKVNKEVNELNLKGG